MKRLLLALLAFLPLAAAAQSDSTAIRIVDRYLNIMNVQALPADSMLVVNTQIVYPTTGDTLTMRRLFVPPQMFRIEVRDSRGRLQTGLCGNGKDRFRAFSAHGGQWRDITVESYYNRLGGFDIRATTTPTSPTAEAPNTKASNSRWSTTPLPDSSSGPTCSSPRAS